MILGDLTQRDALADDLCARVRNPNRTADELRVLSAVFARLEIGAVRHGPMVLADDKRDWSKERLEELLDERIYREIAVLVGDRR